jgi:hypothetical protein
MMIRHTLRPFKRLPQRDLSAILFICPVHSTWSLAAAAVPHEDDDQAEGVTFTPARKLDMVAASGIVMVQTANALLDD